MIKAVAATLTAVMLTAFMLRDHTWTDSRTTIMVTLFWILSVYLWWREIRLRRAGSHDSHDSRANSEPHP